MKRTLTVSDIANELLQDENASWSYAGARALAEYLDDLDESCGTETEFERCAIRGQYSEYGSALEAVSDYDYDGEPDEGEPDETAALEWLCDRTAVIRFDGGIIIADW